MGSFPRTRWTFAGLGTLVAAVIVAGTGAAGDSRAGSHAFATPANGRIALVDSTSELISVNPDGSGRRVLARCAAANACPIRGMEWSPDGTRLLFFRRAGAARAGTYSLFVVDARGRLVRRVASCGHCGLMFGSRARWSPSGTQIVFTGTSGLMVVRATGTRTRQLTQCESPCMDRSPAWSPDGSKIAFARGDSLYSVDADGSNLTKLATVDRLAANPAWSPDGRRLVFEGINTMYALAADGSHQTLLFSGGVGSGPYVPSWSPDGTRILFFNTPGTPGKFTAEVWVMAPDGTRQRRLYGSECCVYDWSPPVWAPDGAAIAFSANSAGGVVVLNSDGTRPRTLSARPSDVAWQPIQSAARAPKP